MGFQPAGSGFGSGSGRLAWMESLWVVLAAKEPGLAALPGRPANHLKRRGPARFPCWRPGLKPEIRLPDTSYGTISFSSIL